MISDMAYVFWVVFSPLLDWLAGGLTAGGMMLALIIMFASPLIEDS